MRSEYEKTITSMASFDIKDNSDNSSDEILQFLQANGSICLSDVKEAMKKKEMEDILSEHPFAKYQGKDGRWYTYVEDDSKPNKRRKIAKISEEKLNFAIYDHYKQYDINELRDQITLKQFYPKWYDFKSLHTYAETYMNRISAGWNKYYLGTSIIDIPLVALKKVTLDEWAHKLIKEYDMTKNEYYNCTVIMRQALEYAVDLEIIPKNNMNSVKIDSRRMFRKVRKKEDSTQVYTREELEQLKELAWLDYNKKLIVNDLAPLAVMFQFQTGLRVGELVAVRYSDIEKNVIHIQRMVRRDYNKIVEHTKGSFGDREVFLTSEAHELIKAAKRRQEEEGIITEYIFSKNEHPLIIRAVTDLFTRYCKKMGIVHKSSHKARKTYISTLIDGNVNINTIREQVGHTDERTTYNNYCFDRSSNEEKALKIESALT